MNTPAPDWFLRCKEVAESLLNLAGVLIVVNVKGKTLPIDDYQGTSIITEFLSGKELDEIVKYFAEANIYAKVIVDEQGFVDWLLNERPNFPRKYCFVYNLAQNGTGSGRLTTIAALCRVYGIPVIDSSPYATAIVHHKYHSLSLLTHFGLPVAKCWGFAKSGWVGGAPPQGLKVIAKPSFESASIGVTDDSVFEVDGSTERRLLEKTAEYRQVLTVQEFVEGFEIEVPVFEAGRPETLCSVGIEFEGKKNLAGRILSYETVFSDDYSFYDLKDLDQAAAKSALETARTAFALLEMSGIGRVDFRLRATGEPLIMEVNSKPHITDHSSFMFALESIGQKGSDLARFLLGSSAIRVGLSS